MADVRNEAHVSAKNAFALALQYSPECKFPDECDMPVTVLSVIVSPMR